MKLGTEILFEKKYRVYWHLLFWMVALAFLLFQSSLSTPVTVVTILRSTLFLSVKIAAAYFTIYFLVPRYLLHKKYGVFFLLLAISALIFSITDRAVYYYITVPLLSTDYQQRYIHAVAFLQPAILFGNLVNTYMLVALAVSIKLLKNLFEKQHLNQMLMQQKVEAELKFLKSQINPHFLFNSLNNLYGLALKNSSETPEAILTLSSLLNYMLYECNSDRIPLEKEIDMLNDFIELEKLRYGSKLKIDFNISGNITGTEIAPMLLFPFIENSFKHGASNEFDQSWININIEVKENTFHLLVENIKSEKNDTDPLYKSDGIGLANIKRQLDLLYPGRHELIISDKGNSFQISLVINLD